MSSGDRVPQNLQLVYRLPDHPGRGVLPDGAGGRAERDGRRPLPQPRLRDVSQIMQHVERVRVDWRGLLQWDLQLHLPEGVHQRQRLLVGSEPNLLQYFLLAPATAARIQGRQELRRDANGRLVRVLRHEQWLQLRGVHDDGRVRRHSDLFNVRDLRRRVRVRRVPGVQHAGRGGGNLYGESDLLDLRKLWRRLRVQRVRRVQRLGRGSLPVHWDADPVQPACYLDGVLRSVRLPLGDGDERVHGNPLSMCLFHLAEFLQHPARLRLDAELVDLRGNGDTLRSAPDAGGLRHAARLLVAVTGSSVIDWDQRKRFRDTMGIPGLLS